MPKKFSLELRERAVRMILKRQATQGASFARDPSHGTVTYACISPKVAEPFGARRCGSRPHSGTAISQVSALAGHGRSPLRLSSSREPSGGQTHAPRPRSASHWAMRPGTPVDGCGP